MYPSNTLAAKLSDQPYSRVQRFTRGTEPYSHQLATASSRLDADAGEELEVDMVGVSVVAWNERGAGVCAGSAGSAGGPAKQPGSAPHFCVRPAEP